jgi:hypothetical protein
MIRATGLIIDLGGIVDLGMQIAADEVLNWKARQSSEVVVVSIFGHPRAGGNTSWHCITK